MNSMTIIFIYGVFTLGGFGSCPGGAEVGSAAPGLRLRRVHRHRGRQHPQEGHGVLRG